MPYCTGCCRGTGPCTSGIPRRRRGATSNTMSCGAPDRRGRRRRRRRRRRYRPRPSPRRMVLRRLSPVCWFGFGPLLPARLTLLSVFARGLLQKDDDEDVEDADHGLFRHLAGRTQRRDPGRFELLARRPSPSPGLDGHDRHEHCLALARRHLPVLRRPALRFISAPLPRCVSTYRSCGGWSPGSSWHSPLVAFDPK